MLKKCLLLLGIIFVAQLVVAEVPNEIRYNGKLKEYRTEVSATKDMNFKIYDQLTGGTAKWESGTKSVKVSSGIFSVVLSPEIDWRNKDLYLEIEVDSKKLEPREKLTAVPYSLHSKTTENIIVKDGESVSVSVGDKKILKVNKETNGFSVSVDDNKVLTIDNNDTTFISGSQSYYMVPKGAIIIWSGSVNNIPSGWALCDGQNGTPDLRDRFVLGAGNTYSVGSTGGETAHQLTINELPSHSHNFYTSAGEATTQSGYAGNGEEKSIYQTLSTSSVGDSKSHNNMPPYYSLCYIMRK